jgi:hypothetical protein
VLRGFEIGAGFVEAGGGSVLMFARMAARIETAMPFPRVFVMRVAAADRDRTGEHVTIVDVPAFLTGIGRSAAGEGGHSSSNCGIEGVGKPSYSLGLKIRAESARGGTRGPPEAMPWHDELIYIKRRASAADYQRYRS